MNRLVFIDYLSRSGSTIVCSELHKIKDLNVTPEFRTGIFRDPYVENESIETYENHWRELLAHPKNQRFVGLTQEENISIASHFDAIEKLLDMAKFLSNDGEICIKGGGYFTIYWDKYLKSNKDHRLIYIYRDPRAIYSSQKRSIDSLKSKPMKTSLIRFVYEVLLYNKFSIRESYKRSVYRVKFEEFVANKEVLIKDLCNWLDVGFCIDPKKNYFDVINNEERYLHENIKKPLKSEYNTLNLGFFENFLLNSILYQYLKQENYPVYRLYSIAHLLLKPVVWLYSFAYARIK